MRAQLKELAINDTIIAFLPNHHKLAVIFLPLPVATTLVERSFSQIKMIKTRLRNRIGELSLYNLMKIAMESPDTLSDNNVEEIVCGVGKTEELQFSCGTQKRISLTLCAYSTLINKYTFYMHILERLKGGGQLPGGGGGRHLSPPK